MSTIKKDPWCLELHRQRRLRWWVIHENYLQGMCQNEHMPNRSICFPSEARVQISFYIIRIWYIRMITSPHQDTQDVHTLSHTADKEGKPCQDETVHRNLESVDGKPGNCWHKGRSIKAYYGPADMKIEGFRHLNAPFKGKYYTLITRCVSIRFIKSYFLVFINRS